MNDDKHGGTPTAHLSGDHSSDQLQKLKLELRKRRITQMQVSHRYAELVEELDEARNFSNPLLPSPPGAAGTGTAPAAGQGLLEFMARMIRGSNLQKMVDAQWVLNHEETAKVNDLEEQIAELEEEMEAEELEAALEAEELEAALEAEKEGGTAEAGEGEAAVNDLGGKEGEAKKKARLS